MLSFPRRVSGCWNFPAAGTFRDNAERCPRLLGNESELETLLALPRPSDICEEVVVFVFRCRSPNGDGPWAPEGFDGMRGVPGMAAIFLNVILHPTSSPANTVDCDHSTQTRMFEVGGGILGVCLRSLLPLEGAL